MLKIVHIFQVYVISEIDEEREREREREGGGGGGGGLVYAEAMTGASGGILCKRILSSR